MDLELRMLAPYHKGLPGIEWFIRALKAQCRQIEPTFVVQRFFLIM